jgi:glycosyltransferase involved in cell wall biosynthesis
MGQQIVKILLCSNHFSPLVGGCEAVTGKIADYLAQCGHEVFVATRRLRDRNPRNYPNLKFLEYIPGRFREFEISMIQIDPDVCFIYSDVFDFTRQLIFHDKIKRIVLALCGANWLHANKNYVNYFYRHSHKIDALICHSKCDRDYKLCTVSKLHNKIVVIPNGVDLEEFQSNKLTRNDLLPKFDKLHDKPWILNVSNFFPGKGQHHLVNILNRLPKKQSFVYVQVSADIDFAVGKRLEEEWKKLCSLDLNPNIDLVFRKNIPRKEVVGFFNNSNVFVFPSEKEVAPIVLLEAMAAGLPWISADIGNARDLKGGHFIPTARTTNYYSVIDERVKKLFANAIQDLYQKPAVGEEGRQHIISELNWDKILPQYASVIERNAQS